MFGLYMARAVFPPGPVLAGGSAQRESENLFNVGEGRSPLAIAAVPQKLTQGLVLAHGSHASNPQLVKCTRRSGLPMLGWITTVGG